jgi:hypothetical protein
MLCGELYDKDENPCRNMVVSALKPSPRGSAGKKRITTKLSHIYQVHFKVWLLG